MNEFFVPEVVTNIRDIKVIYDMNDIITTNMERDLKTLEDNILLDTSTEKMVERYEKMLGLVVFDNDTMQQRICNIQAKINEKLPYSYRVVMRRIETITGKEGAKIDINAAQEYISVMLEVYLKSVENQIRSMLEEIVPLNMLIKISIIYNIYSDLNKFSHRQLKQYTHDQLRNEVLL